MYYYMSYMYYGKSCELKCLVVCNSYSNLDYSIIKFHNKNIRM